MLKFLKSKGSIKKNDKDVCLVAQDDPEEDALNIKVNQDLLRLNSLFFHHLTKAELKKYHKTKLEGVTTTALKKIVEYLYQQDAYFENYYEALETLQAAHKYQFESLQEKCVEYLIGVIETKNVCEIFEMALSLSLSYLQYSCLKLIDEKAPEVFTTRGFLSAKKFTIRKIISRNSLDIRNEKAVFDALLGWSLNDILRKGLDPNNQDELIKIISPLLPYVRISTMSNEELNDPDMLKHLCLLRLDENSGKPRTMSDISQTSMSSIESTSSTSREYVSKYCAPLHIFQSQQNTIKPGETFCLRVEVLKGMVFLTGVNLAVGLFAPTKDTACLYVVITATNVVTAEQVTKRGAFLSISEKAALCFSTPLAAKESERVEIALSVKRVENVCPFSINNDVQIIMPDSQKIALKIVHPSHSLDTEEVRRCIFKEIEYFY